MSTHEFNNDSDQRTRKQVHKDTLMARAQGEYELERQGRHAQPNRFTGATPATLYPTLPADAPQNQMAAMGNTEPAFSEDVNAPVVVGEAWEIEQSLGPGSATTSSSAVEPDAPPSQFAPLAAEEGTADAPAGTSGAKGQGTEVVADLPTAPSVPNFNRNPNQTARRGL